MLKQTLALIGLTLSISANAALVDVIAALNPGDQYRVLFITSTLTDAYSSNIDDYNTIANNAGTSGSVTSGLGLNWKALASTSSVDACGNTGSCAPDTAPVSIFNTQGHLLATSYSDLWDGDLSFPVGYDENGTGTRDSAWTGTSASGVGGQYLLGDSIGWSGTGSAGETSYFWIVEGGSAQAAELGVYALSDVAAVVPIPAAAWLFGSALLGLGVVKRRKA